MYDGEQFNLWKKKEKEIENESNIIKDGKNLLILGTFLSINKKKINTNQ